MGDLALNFDRVEFACPGGLHTPVDARLLGLLQRLRQEVGRPLAIVSGYRTASHNTAVGGAPDSLHLWGMAADIPAGYCTVSQATRIGFAGIGIRSGQVVHLDVRESGLIVFDDSPSGRGKQ